MARLQGLAPAFELLGEGPRFCQHQAVVERGDQQRIASLFIDGPRNSRAVARIFREAYWSRRCILPVEGFYEWMATKGGKQPYAIAMKDRSPFGIAGKWEN